MGLHPNPKSGIPFFCWQIALDRMGVGGKRLAVHQRRTETARGGYREVLDDEGNPREIYAPLFQRLKGLSRSDLRRTDEQLEATMREMGVTFDIVRERPWGRRPWYCDLLPQIFSPEDWRPLARGVVQRLRAYECFLRDVYGEQRILRSGRVPLQPVLGSPHFQRAAMGLEPCGGAYLHLSGAVVARCPDGRFVVKHHYFSHASGISYMIQNRRAMARVMPDSFLDYSIHSIADAPTNIVEVLRNFSHEVDPTVVLLSAGQGSAVYSEHSFLARRMGIPVVQGGDLLVLNDRVYLKTVSGLEKVEVIYSRVSDNWLDPLVFNRKSVLGVPGLVQCIRKGTVTLINPVGSQLADDRAMLSLAPILIRYYLGEAPILDGLETYWLGDLDQREMVLTDIESYIIRPIYGEHLTVVPREKSRDTRKRRQIIREILADPAGFVAQPIASNAQTLCYEGGSVVDRWQDHIVFALRRAEGDYTIFPGALTRVSTKDPHATASELGGGSKDTWVEASPDEPLVLAPRLLRDVRLPSHLVTSRVAESLYWIGRYLERARSLAGMIGVIETLETEELNPTERTLYRPVWNKMLPPLENESGGRRNISDTLGRYRLTLDVQQNGSVVNIVQRALWNAESVLECLSLEAWSVLSHLQARFQRTRFRENLPDARRASATRKMCDHTTDRVAQFFGTAEMTIVEDGGWRFCQVGQMIERASTTANAIASMARSLLRTTGPSREHAREIQLSAFLRLLNSRDMYRRVYQMRTEPGALLQMFYLNPAVPRSITRCLTECRRLLTQSQSETGPAMQRTAVAIENLLHSLAQTDWEILVAREIERPSEASIPDTGTLIPRVDSILSETLNIHHLISDGFLNHQIHMSDPEQPLLEGFRHAV